jgi:DtxR family Mn-dependent transcriptional regulator
MEEHVEELLQRLWMWEEEDRERGMGAKLLEEEMDLGGGAGDRISGGFSGQSRGAGRIGELKVIEGKGLITLKDGFVYLSDRGREIARTVVRNHRLAERLLMEVFEIGDREAHSSACKFEHILSPQVTDRVCTFLGHPPTCPHGKVIPSGVCCKIFGTHIEPLVQPLTNLSVGKNARIVFITPSYQTRLERLGSLGLTPGGVLKLKQRYPSYVVEIDETTVALDRDVGKEIFVREVS